MMNSIRDNLRDYVNLEDCSAIMIDKYKTDCVKLETFDKEFNTDKESIFKKSVMEFYSFINSIIPRALINKIITDLINTVKQCESMEDISSLESALRSWTNDMPIIEESDNEEFNFENKSTAIIEKLKSKAGIITANAEKLKLLIKYNGVEFNRYIEKCPTRKISKSMLGVLQSCFNISSPRNR